MAASIDYSTSSSFFLEELEILESIYIEELTVNRHGSDKEIPYTISLQLHPATGEDLGKRYVCMTLVLDIPLEYPNKTPDIAIRNPRGMCDEELQSLLKAMKELAADRQGGHMLYELIEIAKEVLTEGNIPRCPCVICLDHFQEGDIFVKTDCYHYYHSYCLCRYVEHLIKKEEEQKDILHMIKLQKKMIPCPVCREEIECNLEELRKAPVINDTVEEYSITEEMKVLRDKMDKLFTEQKQKGGIIDVEAEKQKFYIPTEITVTDTTEPQRSNQDICKENSTKTGTKEESKKQENHSSSYQSGYGRAKPGYDRNTGEKSFRGFRRPYSREDRGSHKGRSPYRNSERPYYQNYYNSNKANRTNRIANNKEDDDSGVKSRDIKHIDTKEEKVDSMYSNSESSDKKGNVCNSDYNQLSDRSDCDSERSYDEENADRDKNRTRNRTFYRGRPSRSRNYHNDNWRSKQDYQSDRDSRPENYHSDSSQEHNYRPQGYNNGFRGRRGSRQTNYNDSRNGQDYYRHKNYNNSTSRQDSKQEKSVRSFNFTKQRTGKIESGQENNQTKAQEYESSVLDSDKDKLSSDTATDLKYSSSDKKKIDDDDKSRENTWRRKPDSMGEKRGRYFDFKRKRGAGNQNMQSVSDNQRDSGVNEKTHFPNSDMIIEKSIVDKKGTREYDERPSEKCHNESRTTKPLISQDIGANKAVSEKTGAARQIHCDKKTSKRPPPGFENNSRDIKPPPGFTDFR